MRGADARRTRRFAVPVAAGVALAVHLVVLASVELFDLSIIGAPFIHSASAAKPEPVESELVKKCWFDVVLASGARATECLGPWHDNAACLRDVPANFWIDMSACKSNDSATEPAQQIAMVEKPAMDKIKQIDPEPLLEMMKDAQKPPPPPEVPKQGPQPPPPPPEQARRMQMQIVETVKPKTEQAPDNTRFLSEYDTKVDKQTVARGTPNEAMVAKSKPADLQPKEQPRDPSVQQHPDKPPGHVGAPDVPGTLAMRAPGSPAPPDLQQDAKLKGMQNGATGPATPDGYTPHVGDGAFEQQRRDRTEVPRGQGGAGGGAPDTPNLKPSQDVLERALGGGNVDHVEDVEEGDETAFNSKKSIAAGFFNRLKRSVAQNWDPASVWRRVDPTGNVNGFKTRVTEVRVTLTPAGELQKIVVTAPSGVTDLDDEAVRAFHAAQPFPNPPKLLVGKDGNITFAFSFFFEIGSPHTAWRVIHSM